MDQALFPRHIHSCGNSRWRRNHWQLGQCYKAAVLGGWEDKQPLQCMAWVSNHGVFTDFGSAPSQPIMTPLEARCPGSEHQEPSLVLCSDRVPVKRSCVQALLLLTNPLRNLACPATLAHLGQAEQLKGTCPEVHWRDSIFPSSLHQNCLSSAREILHP